MKTLALAAIATTLLASTASAAPLQAAKIASRELGAIDQVRLVCNEFERRL
jgi:hypothetical protein